MEQLKTPNELSYKRLGFFQDFIAAAKINYETVAAQCGLCRPTIYHWLRRDDTKLSYVTSVIEACGYSLTILMTRNNFESPMIIGIKNITQNCKGKYELKPLTFIDAALEQCHISKAELADMLNMSAMGVKTWWVNQDIMISRVYQIAEALNCSIKFHIETKNDNTLQEMNPDNRIISSEIIMKNVTIIGER